jgi:hypothetical protein
MITGYNFFGRLILFFFLLGLEFELNALHLQSKCFTALATPQFHSLRWLVWRWVLENHLPGVALNCDLED